MEKGKRKHDYIYLDTREFKEKQIFKDILNLINPEDGDSYIDIGCSNGAFIKSIINHVPKGSNVFGIDIDQSLLEIANKNVPEAKFMKHDISMNAPDGFAHKFDYAFLIGVHTIFDNLQPLLKSCKSFLKFNGKLFVAGSFSISNYDLITRVRKSGQELFETGFNRHSLNSLEKAAKELGYTSFESRPFYMREKIKRVDDPLRSYHSLFDKNDFSKSILQNGIGLLCNQFIVSLSLKK